MLIRKSILQRIATGEVTCQFRVWDRPRVRPGSTQLTSIGLVGFDAVTEVDAAALTGADALAAGFHDLAALRNANTPGEGQRVYRIDLHQAGDDPRIALRERAELTADEIAAIIARLARLDRASPRGPWTRTFLELIQARPIERAQNLADDLGWVKDDFKLNVRKLKGLGLTESFPAGGYRISPRGSRILNAIGARG